jgi:membrane-bound lytic murein transglycosylase A
MRLKQLTILLLLFLLTNCAGKSEYIKLEKASFPQLKSWSKDNHRRALNAFIKSCHLNKKVPSALSLKQAPKNVVQNEWIKTCKLAKKSKNPRRFFEQNFVPFLVKGKKGEKGIFTGYYEVELEGSVIKTNKYRHPVYLPSKKTNTKISRARIENGALNNKKLEVAYVSDKVGLFFMHTQGSGKIRVSKNSYIKLGYAGQNGYPYYHIGNYLTKNNLIDKNTASAESIINWLKKNPRKAAKIMHLNESYIFFQPRKERHPVGAMGVEVTPMRTLAVDRRFIPLGIPLWLETSYPREKKSLPLKPFNRIMIAQDVGGAIKGPVRGDVFFGGSKQAERAAWYMANKGKYFILVPKEIAKYIRPTP